VLPGGSGPELAEGNLFPLGDAELLVESAGLRREGVLGPFLLGLRYSRTSGE
jgi:hypothetical protein